jgi:hypothetical protein
MTREQSKKTKAWRAWRCCNPCQVEPYRVVFSVQWRPYNAVRVAQVISVVCE